MAESRQELQKIVKENLRKLQLLQFITCRYFEGGFHLYEKKSICRYETYIFRDPQQALGLDILNRKHVFSWMYIKIIMSEMEHWNHKLINKFWYVKDISNEESYKTVEILDYVMPDLNTISDSQTHLTREQRDTLLNMISKQKKL